jgi:tetratricopeptide (TPR) repeat protein
MPGLAPAPRWAFRLAAVLLPAVLLGLLELVLRLTGYGYSTHFFSAASLTNSTVMVENPKFGWQFFPPALARRPEPVMFSATKPNETYRIFVLGESAAQGHPDPAYSFARCLSVLLADRYPGTRFEVVNTGTTAINSHAIRQIGHDCAAQRADLWVLYMGHNEVIGPFGAGSVFGPRASSQWLIRASLAVKSTRVGQLLDAGLRLLTPRSNTPAEWRGLEMFSQERLSADDPHLEAVYRSFQSNLDDLIRTSLRAGVRMVVCTTACNLGDCAPFASLHRASLSAADLAHWEKLFHAGVQAEAAEHWPDAIQSYLTAAEVDPQFAELQFRWGRCCLRAGRDVEARQHFILARDYDALRLRADSRLNQIIRQTAARPTASSVSLLDASELLAKSCPAGLPGDDLFYEHVHFTLAGNYHLARLLAEQITGTLPDPIARSAKPGAQWLSLNECAQRLAWTPWDRYRIGSQMARWLRTPPFSSQLDHEQRDRRWAEHLTEWRSATAPSNLRASIETYRAALARSPDDWRLHQNLAPLLEESGDLDSAIQQLQAAATLLPFESRFPIQVAGLLDRKGQSAAAEAAYLAALKLEPDSVEALNGLGLARAHQDRYAEAVPPYLKAIKLRPDLVEAHINLGLAWFALHNTPGAIAEHRIALRLEPDNVAAHINLGKLLQSHGDLEEAAGTLKEAVRLAPENPLAHFNLANVLAALRWEEDSLVHYAEAARLRPDAPEVHSAYGLALAAAGRPVEATAELSTAVRLDPDDPQAHFNLGRILLDRADRPAAEKELRAALRLDPNHAGAAEFLSRLGVKPN